MDVESWIPILLSGVLAACLSVIISAIFGWRSSKREAESGFVQARAELHSHLYFWLRIWLTRDIDVIISWEDFKDIDKYLSMRLHFVSSEIQEKWLELHGKVVDREFEDAVNIAIELVELVQNEFNSKIIPKYEKYVGKNIQKLASYARESISG